ncbi:ATPase [Methanocella sp. CWC-04]|uniref:ATPase n=1 Tax=Methanooceanicella nereidis TaxID=2052831 RepID=A0AAP2RFK6_9EURY|nr:ATP-binding protein [Methanocella sp. CWC-04]MCD1295210.1 ATPase [Methanocella sp. CWC-04]
MKPIGIVRDVEENDVNFISSIKLKSGDFVIYRDRWVDNERPVLCRVNYARSLRTYPDEFIMNSDISPAQILEFSGMDADDYSKYLITASVIGYFNEAFKEFRHPRTMPDSGESIYPADNNSLKDICKIGYGSKGSAFIGTIPGSDVPVAISVKDVVSQHLSVIAATGSGKSYTVGVILEELMKPDNRAAVMVVDPHGEYTTLSGMQNSQEFRQDDYRPSVKIFRKNNIRLKVSELDIEDFLGMLGLTEKMEAFFVKAYYNLPDNRNFKKTDLKREIEMLADSTNESTIKGIIWRFERAMRSSIFDDYQHTPLQELFNVGQLSILDVSGLGQGEQQLITSVLLRRLFDAREGTVNQHYEEGKEKEKYLPYPVFVVLEEAHRFAPQNGEAKSKSILKTILSEGRKFGIGVCMVSQRPSKLDSDSLSQCMTQVTMKIINPVDQNQIASSIESMSSEILNDLPALSKGEAIVSGVAINTPVLVRIRQRITDHGGISRDAPEEWAAQWKKKMENGKIPALNRKDYKLF